MDFHGCIRKKHVYSRNDEHTSEYYLQCVRAYELSRIRADKAPENTEGGHYENKPGIEFASLDIAKRCGNGRQNKEKQIYAPKLSRALTACRQIRDEQSSRAYAESRKNGNYERGESVGNKRHFTSHPFSLLSFGCPNISSRAQKLYPRFLRIFSSKSYFPRLLPLWQGVLSTYSRSTPYLHVMSRL